MTDPYRHSRVGGPFIGTRTIRRLRLSAESRESLRDSSETRQSTGWGCTVIRQNQDFQDYGDLQDCDDDGALLVGCWIK